MDDVTLAELARDYPRLTSRQLTLISNEAYERAHAYGQEQVNVAARDIAHFVNAILEAQ